VTCLQAAKSERENIIGKKKPFMWCLLNDHNNSKNAYNNVIVVVTNNQQSTSFSGVLPLLQVLTKTMASG
jgi:hypothetical protein